jgi:assimilatory nitrate reductase catalytic subunit
VSPAFPFSLNTGRVRDQWHTMTRTGLAPELCRHAPEPVIDIHPEDAAAHGLIEGRLTRLITPRGEAVAPVHLTTAQRRGDVFLPMHWTALFAPSGRSNGLIAPDVDATSGQPELKHAPARIAPYRETWRGFYIAAAGEPTPPTPDLIWRRLPRDGCQVHEFAGRGDEAERTAVLSALIGAPRGELLSMDDATGSLRRAVLDGGRLSKVLCIAVGEARLPPRDWLADRFMEEAIAPAHRPFLLAGLAPGFSDLGSVICACRNVRRRTLTDAVTAGARDLDALGAVTGAGVTCGSCRPELARLLVPTPIEARHAA